MSTIALTRRIPETKWSAPDLEKAKQLVEESGTKGQKVTMIAEDKAVSKSIGVYLQSVLDGDRL